MEELGNLIPVKICHLEENYNSQNKEIHEKLLEIKLFLLNI